MQTAPTKNPRPSRWMRWVLRESARTHIAMPWQKPRAGSAPVAKVLTVRAKPRAQSARNG